MGEEFCPVCGYYCLGKGGAFCIDKPKLCGYEEKGMGKRHSSYVEAKRESVTKLALWGGVATGIFIGWMIWGGVGRGMG